MSVIVLPTTATIVSTRNGSNTVTGASRDDLQVGDLAGLESYSNATTYAWSFVYKPAGSTATFSGSSTAKNPGNFTVDAIGSYLVKLIVDAGLATEDEQVVRLRRLSALGQKLPGAGEFKNNTNSVPVDVSASGWTNDMNANLLLLESSIGGSGAQGFQGSQGSHGFQGFQGSQGPQGNQGFQGFQGGQGFQGAQGSQGFQGALGNQGFQGFQGAQGGAGFQGFQGFQGGAGSQGSQGVLGAQGFQGFRGYQGSLGNQGNQGSQGTSGTGISTSTIVSSITIGATTTIPSFGTRSIEQVVHRTLGDRVRLSYKMGWAAGTGAGSGDYLVNLPSGVLFKTTTGYNPTYTGTLWSPTVSAMAPYLIPAEGGVVMSGIWNGLAFVMPYTSSSFRLLIDYGGFLAWGSSHFAATTDGLLGIDFEIWKN
jgi:hypothetical protein